ncbi:unnamed protein product [Durusdinium trenchii]|uniref:Uncharacterized protein n=2 Tax=Durusdinium trenchii TaxID=1381693 RepID=A0ABP0QIM1_9DINO
MFKRFVAMQTRRPVATCLVTGASVMSIGDSAVQLCGSGTLDVERNVVVSAYNAGSAPFFYFWWQTLDGMFPGKGWAAVARKTLVNQATMAPFNSALFLTWSTALEPWIKTIRKKGKDDPKMSNIWEKVKSKVQSEIPELVVSQCGYWLPANAVNFMFMPQHLRVVFMSTCAVIWGGYISYVVHR